MKITSKRLGIHCLISIAFLAVTLNVFGQSSGQLFVNEVEFDPPSSINEGCQYVEIRGANVGGTVPANTWFITIDNSNANPGNIAFAVNIGGTVVGTNGTITILNSAAGTCPNRVYGSGTTVVNVSLPLGLGFFSSRAFLLLTSTTTLTSGQNIDQNQDGQFDFAVTVIDGFAFNLNSEEEFNYGGSPQIYAPTSPTTDVPDAVVRFSGNNTPMNVGAFYWAEVAETPEETVQLAAPFSPNFPQGGILTPGGPNLPTTAAPQKAIVDFNGDGKTDFTVTRLSGGLLTWFSSINGTGEVRASQWGLQGDIAIPEDYDGDGKDDIAVWRPAAATVAAFYIIQSSDSTVRVVPFGQTGDDPALTGDWDGDGKADPAVYRNAAIGQQSYFFFRASQNNPSGNITYGPWGTNGDQGVRGDFDGDDKQDGAVFRPSDNTWWIVQSSNSQHIVVPFGLASDMKLSADFDGDRKTDIAIFRAGVWWVRQSSSGQIRIVNWGLAGDTPVPGDYDGDGSADFAVWRNGIFYVQSSASGNITYFNWGLSGDGVVASVFNN